MELWNLITDTPRADPWPLASFLTLSVVAALAGVLVVSSRIAAQLARKNGRDLTGSEGLDSRRWVNYLPGACVVLIAIAVVAGTLTTVIVDGRDRARYEAAIEGHVADYLYTELGLVPLSPVDYLMLPMGPDIGLDLFRDERPGVATTVVQDDGSTADVQVTWVDVESTPYRDSWQLPESFDPITVEITPASK